MSIDRAEALLALRRAGLEELRRRWAWFFGLGVLLIVLGTLAIGASVVTTLATMVFIGWLMIFAGFAQGLHAFTCRAWEGFFLDLLLGTLYGVTGCMVVGNPGATAVALTLLIAVLLIFGGVSRIIGAIMVNFPNRWWVLLSGAITLMLGISIAQAWPWSGFMVIGLFMGVDMIFNGWSLVMLGGAAKNLPKG